MNKISTKTYRKEGELDFEVRFPPIPCSKYVIIGNPKKRKPRRPRTPLWDPYNGKPIMKQRNKMDKCTIYSDEYFSKPDVEEDTRFTVPFCANPEDEVEKVLLPRLAGINLTARPPKSRQQSRRKRKRKRRENAQRSAYWRFKDEHVNMQKADHYCDVLGPTCCGVCYSRRMRNLAAAKSYESLPVVELTAASLVAPTLASQLMRAAKLRRSNHSRKRNRNALRRGTRGIETMA